MKTTLNIIPIEQWLSVKSSPLIVAGPCSAESKSQLIAVAKEIAKIPQVRIFRAGLWKPRTRPSSFEGVGNKGFAWLNEVKKKTGLKIAVEIANPSHVEQCLKNKIDVLWIGARTVVNPFSIQEIAKALKGTDVPVFIKNPIHPDVSLWLGAVERIYSAGIRKIVAVHRGFYHFDKTSYRNAPLWEIPIELKRQCPTLPIICDPSHICGSKKLLFEVSQKALDLEMDGLMIEVHNNPKKAFTDANQQITPAELKKLINHLILRSSLADKVFNKPLKQLRLQIDELDEEMISILAKRMRIVEKIGQYKKEHNITILQLERWDRIFKDRISKGSKQGLDKDFLLEFLELIHREAINKQTLVMNNKRRTNNK